MNTITSKHADEGDVLLGAKRIAEYITQVMGVPHNEDDIYYAHRAGKLPIGKYGAFLIASNMMLNDSRSFQSRVTRFPPVNPQPETCSSAVIEKLSELSFWLLICFFSF